MVEADPSPVQVSLACNFQIAASNVKREHYFAHYVAQHFLCDKIIQMEFSDTILCF